MLKIAFDTIYAHPLPKDHKFPMEKYELLPQQLIYEGTVTENNFFKPKPIDEEVILKTHDETYFRRLKNLEITPREQRKTGFPHSKELIDREITIMGGTFQASEYAMEFGVAFNIAGGTHHAYTNRGEGFCLLNDIAIAANQLLNLGLVKKVLVVDLDVHQGNGTAQIFQNNADVFTFSMHGKNNYPLHKEVSDLDIELLDGTDNKTYLKILREKLPKLLELHQPDFIFYQCGVDVLKTDKLGKLGLSIQGCKERDRLVLETAKSNQIPIMVSMGGGYSEKISDIVDAHANTYRLAQEIYF
jgi:acetoin utilization deacetylase AcuC-like enzyme